MKIGLISDTHLNGVGIRTATRTLPAEVATIFAGVERILHAGDLVDLRVLDLLRAIAPVEAVAGNVDPLSIAQELGRKKIVTIGAARIGLTHGDLGVGRTTPERARRSFGPGEVDVVVFGHSHQPLITWEDGILLVNPGSACEPRREPRPSVGLLHLGETIEAEIRYLTENR